MNKKEVLEKLKSISYPGFNRDIVSFGMVKDIKIENNDIEIILKISSQNKRTRN